MKLHELLASYKGQELNSEMISAISSQVDIVKESAVTAATSKFKDFDKMKTELKEFREAKSQAEFKETWKKAGGKDTDLSNYNLDKFKGEDGKLNFDNLFKELPHLKGDAPTPQTSENKNGIFSQLTNITQPSSQPSSQPGGEDISVY